MGFNPPRPDFERAARDHQATRLKPPGSLGRLEELAVRIAAFQRTETPTCRPAAAIVFAADHPVTRHGVSRFPSSVTAAMLEVFAAGGAACNVFARATGSSLRIVDVGVAHPYEVSASAAVTCVRDPVADAPVGDLVSEDAMPPETFEAAWEAGRRSIDALDPAVRSVLLGEMGIGNTTPAAAVTGHLLGLSAEKVTGPGTGQDAEGLRRKREIVSRALERARDTSPTQVLRALGGRELAAIAGAATRAFETRRLVVVDGFIVTAAIAAAQARLPALHEALIFAHRSQEPGHAALLEHFREPPLLDLGLRLGEATGALAALPLLDLACALHNEMWSFADAGL